MPGGRARLGSVVPQGGVLHAIAPASALGQVIALRVHLDDSTAENGPLRVLPGTRVHGVLSRQQIETLATAVTRSSVSLPPAPWSRCALS
jgi:hypothetical protein